MNKFEAIEILEEVKILDDSMYQYNTTYLNALDMAIESLKTDAIPVEWIMTHFGALKVALDIIESWENRVEYGIDWIERKEE